MIGRPNVGKSTLLNKILDFNISIVSSKPQTTRNKIKGIYNDLDSQIIFLDTPGIHKPKQKLGERMNNFSYSTINDSDVILFLKPSNEKIGPGDKMIFEKIMQTKNKQIAAIITKIDLVGNEEVLLPQVKELKQIGFKDVIGVSNRIPESIDILINYLKEKLKDGTPYFPQDELTDKTHEFLIEEIIRESSISLLKDEIPHSIGVIIKNFKRGENKWKIDANIYVERESQKKIVIGERGRLINKVRKLSSQKIESIFNVKSSLLLHVKVDKKWTNKLDKLKKMGY